MCMRKDLKYPCGKCLECLQARRNEWAIRLKNEIAMYEPNTCYFITLTYSNENLPYLNGKPSLSKRDIELFIKRLRFYVEPSRFKFFGCGEYGPTTFRPHYHIIIFGFPKKEMSEAKELFNKAWRKGQVRKPWYLVPAQCMYATKYLITDSFWPEGTQKPFNKMSQGLGLCMLEDLANKVYLYDKDLLQEYAESICEEYGVVVYEPNKQGDLIPHFGLSQVEESKLDSFASLVQDFVRSPTDKTGKLSKFQIPKYIRQKLFSNEIRLVLNAYHDLERKRKNKEYENLYGEYDKLNPSNPMWKQHAKLKYERLISRYNKQYKSKKDKNIIQ